MLLGVIKELIGELTRYNSDKEVNNTPVVRMALPGSRLYAGSGSREILFENIRLADVKVGDILKIEDDKQVPADCILLKVADNKPECFVKTAALDGERNLKPKLTNEKISRQFDEMFQPGAQQDTCGLRVSCIPPTKELYYFEGRLYANLPDNPDFSINLDLN